MDHRTDTETAFELRKIYSLLWRLGLFFALSFLLVILPVTAYSGYCLYALNRDAEKLAEEFSNELDATPEGSDPEKERARKKLESAIIADLDSLNNPQEEAARLKAQQLEYQRRKQREAVDAENKRRQRFQMPP